MYSIYVLKLNNDKYYVGKSNNVEERINQHFNHCGSEWTKLYPPLSLLFTRPQSSLFDEDNVVKEMMVKYGIDNVRGGSYSTIKLNKEECNVLQKELRSLSDCCLRCGKPGHFINDCKEKKDINNVIINTKIKRKRSGVCSRCGRNNHKRKDCYATTKLNGDLIKTRKKATSL